MISHPYLRYAQALIMCENYLSSVEDINVEHIVYEIEVGLEAFRLKPIEDFYGKEKVRYGFAREEKPNVGKGVFLAPNSITSDMQAKNLWAAANKYISAIKGKDLEFLQKTTEISMSEMPLSGEFLSFSEKIGRGKPKATLMEQGLGIITSLTPNKPCLQYRTGKSSENACIIPDLPIDELVKFVRLFKRMKMQKTKDLFLGNVILEKKKEKDSGTYIPKRPQIFNGNFPNPPFSSALGCIALLGAIGEFTKDVEASEQALETLESLKGKPLYIIKYGNATTLSYNHYVIDLAKTGELRNIVDKLYYSQLYNQDRRKAQNVEYQRFDLFVSRFLHLFTPSAFRDFLAFRAEYENSVELLLNTYFTKMEKIDPEIVSSARQLGKWLNLVAYLAAKSSIKKDTPNYWPELRTTKAKVLIEFESTTLSAKTGDALIAQILIRAGRLSESDAPEAAVLFMEKTISGELALNNAQNLLIAFSRVKNKTQAKEQSQFVKEELDEDDSEYISEC